MSSIAVDGITTDSHEDDGYTGTEATSPLEPISPWPPQPHAPQDSPGSPSRHTDDGDQLPNAKEIYGLIAVLGTYLAFGVYLVWALCPDEWLHKVGWTWYPSRYALAYSICRQSRASS